MNFNDYQKEAFDYARYGDVWFYPFMGLSSEVGEVCGKVKKLIRDQRLTGLSNLSARDRKALKAELGDVLWYLAACAEELKLDLGDIAEYNLMKLSGRCARGKLHGDGDDR